MRRAFWAAFAACSMIATMAAAQPSPGQCPPGKVPPLALPGVKTALDGNRQLIIVAFGSSSTEGSHSSDIAHSYPAVLQAALASALPRAHVAVLNRGIGGQDVTEELPRITTEIIGTHPSLVVWQVGANGAMRHMAPERFKQLVMTGVTRLKDAGIDVVLMDNQRAPVIVASPEHARIDQALADVSVATGAGLFSRGALMEQWRVDGFPYAEFIADDGIHHNDRGYRCVGQALARAILDGLGGPLQIVHAQRNGP